MAKAQVLNYDSTATRGRKWTRRLRWCVGLALFFAVFRLAMMPQSVWHAFFNIKTDDGRIDIRNYFAIGSVKGFVGFDYLDAADWGRGRDNLTIPENPVLVKGQVWPIRYNVTLTRKPTETYRKYFFFMDLFALTAGLLLMAGACWIMRWRVGKLTELPDSVGGPSTEAVATGELGRGAVVLRQSND